MPQPSMELSFSVPPTIILPVHLIHFYMLASNNSVIITQTEINPHITKSFDWAT